MKVSLMRIVTNGIQNGAAVVLQVAPVGVREWYKKSFELLFWKKHLFKTGEFQHAHMLRAFTESFALDRSFFDGKHMLDIGCGPTGSLEWADNAASRTGADPLADSYVKLNGGKQAMRYVNTGAEDMPFDDQSFDVVSIFNALDHVENVDAAIAEALRVTKVGGTLLLIVEINHRATITEPHSLKIDVMDKFEGCRTELQNVYRTREDHDMYASVFDALPRDSETEPGIVVARLVKER